MAINVTLQIAIYISIGIIIQKAKLFKENFTKELTRFVMDVSLPCLVIHALCSQSYENHEPDMILKLMLAGVAFFIVLFIFSQVLFIPLKKTEVARCLHVCTMFSSFAFVGIPIVEGLYGTEGLFAYMLFYTPLRIFYYTLTPIFINPNRATNLKSQLHEIIKVLLTPGIVGTAIGVLLYFTKIPLPEFLSNTISAVGGTCSPLAMIISGMTMGSMSFKQIINDKAAWSMVGVSNFLSPTIILLFVLFLPLPDQIRVIMVLAAALPMPSLLITYAIRFNLNDRLCQSASLAMFASTLISVASVPLWISITEKIL